MPMLWGTDQLAADENKLAETPVKRLTRKSHSDAGAQDGAVGKALRSAYQQTVGEAVPADLLDLLGKLD